MGVFIVLNGVSFSRSGLERITLPAGTGGGGQSAPAFINLTNITQSGSVYTSTASSGLWTANMVSSLKFAGDGNIQWTVNLGSPVKETHLVGLSPQSTHTGDFSTVEYSVAAYNGIYHIFRLGTLTSTGVTAQANDLCRIRRDGTTIYYEYSRNNGATWTSLGQTDVGVSGNLYIHVLLRSNANFITGLVAQGLS